MMPAGKYYVGDLCYVMHPEWDEMMDIFFPDNSGLPKDGEFTLKDGRRFASYSTMYGDGLYPSNIGSNFSVDAGLIGCIRVEDIRDPEATEARMKALGAIVEFGTDFVTESDTYNTGIIQFGRVIIETGDLEEDEEE